MKSAAACPRPSSRGRNPWNPPRRGGAVRCRYCGGTNRGIPARSARMTAEFKKARRHPGGTNRGILRLLTQALNDSVRVQREVAVTADTGAVDAGGSPSPPSSSRSGDPLWRGRVLRHRGRGDPPFPSFSGRSPWNPPRRDGALSLPRRNQPGDSRAERENDSRV